MVARTYVRPKQARPKRSSAQEVLARKKLRQMNYRSKTPATNSKAIMSLTRQVKALKVAEFGQKQISRQIFRSGLGLPDNQAARITAKKPVCFCHQAIDFDNSLYQVEIDPITSTVSSQPIAAWTFQRFPLQLVDPLAGKFDQLKYMQTNSIGVQPGYYHHSSQYNVKFNAVNWRGWVDVLVVTTRKQYTRQASPDIDEFQLPLGLPGFAHTCGGTPNQYSWNPQFFGVKRVKRMYFNTATNVSEQSIGTNPDNFCSFKVSNNKARAHIRAQTTTEYAIPPDPPASPITHLDIPLRQQDWIVITSSDERNPSDTSYCGVNITRVPVWRDTAGSS